MIKNTIQTIPTLISEIIQLTVDLEEFLKYLYSFQPLSDSKNKQKAYTSFLYFKKVQRILTLMLESLYLYILFNADDFAQARALSLLMTTADDFPEIPIDNLVANTIQLYFANKLPELRSNLITFFDKNRSYMTNQYKLEGKYCNTVCVITFTSELADHTLFLNNHAQIASIGQKQWTTLGVRVTEEDRISLDNTKGQDPMAIFHQAIYRRLAELGLSQFIANKHSIIPLNRDAFNLTESSTDYLTQHFACHLGFVEPEAIEQALQQNAERYQKFPLSYLAQLSSWCRLLDIKDFLNQIKYEASPLKSPNLQKGYFSSDNGHQV
ncbi:MAG: hypothetical protein AAGG80_07015, partial [Pseudomonadota bacterium]